MTISNGGSVSETGFDLVEFLKARLDEAEAKVRGWRTFRPDVPEHETEELHHVDGSTSVAVTLNFMGRWIMTEAEYEAWTTEPAEPDHQELRRIEGLRAITRDADEFVREFDTEERLSSDAATAGRCAFWAASWRLSILRNLALEFDGHPDYRSEWRPWKS